MVDPFAMAAAALFRAPGSVAAVYIPAFGPSVSIRIIRGQPDAGLPFGGASIVQATNAIQILRSDISEPQAGDQLTIGDDIFIITGVPTLDVERVTWNCTADPS